jgi:sn-glycerol 3-phosphate transport system permease protein
MIERRPVLDFVAHAVLVIGVLIVAFPVYLTLVASTQSAQDIASSRPLSMLPGSHFLETYKLALFGGETSMGSKFPAAAPMMMVSLISALIIAIGKIAISLLSAFAIVYFRFPLRNVVFLDDFRHADAAGGGAHWPHLRGGL